MVSYYAKRYDYRNDAYLKMILFVETFIRSKEVRALSSLKILSLQQAYECRFSRRSCWLFSVKYYDVVTLIGSHSAIKIWCGIQAYDKQKNW